MTSSPPGEASGNNLERAVELARAVAALRRQRLHQVPGQLRALAALPPQEVARALAAASECSDAERVLAAQTLSLVRTLAALPPGEAARARAAASARTDAEGGIAAKAIAGITTLPYPLDEVAVKTKDRSTTLPTSLEVAAVKTIYLMQDLAVLPTWIATRAVILLGAAAFAAADALAAFDALAARSDAIFAVECWVPAGRQVEWVGVSDYDETQRCRSAGSWAEDVACCLAGARTYVRACSKVKGALFNYAWGDEALSSAVGTGSAE